MIDRQQEFNILSDKEEYLIDNINDLEGLKESMCKENKGSFDANICDTCNKTRKGRYIHHNDGFLCFECLEKLAEEKRLRRLLNEEREYLEDAYTRFE
jgi:hypothetical protein